eukprot:gene5413-6089_t
MDEDDEVIFVKEIKRTTPNSPYQNLFDKFAVGAFRSAFEKLDSSIKLDSGHSTGSIRCNENGTHKHQDQQLLLDDVMSIEETNNSYKEQVSLKNSFALPKERDDLKHGCNGNIGGKSSKVQPKDIGNGNLSPYQIEKAEASKESATKAQNDGAQKQLNLKWTSSCNKVSKSPKSRKRRMETSNGQIKFKKSKGTSDGSPNVNISSSPIARSFFSPSAKVEENQSDKISISMPLLSKLNPLKNLTSLQPQSFANCRVDLLDGLAEDEIFQGHYTNTVLSFTSPSVAPPTNVVMYLLTKVTLCKNPIWSRRAINALHSLMSCRLLNHRNFAPTWEFVVSLSDGLLEQLGTQAKYATSDDNNGDGRNDETDFLSVFTLLVNIMEEDYKRYRINIRESVAWKLMSPSIFGNSRLRNVTEWLTKSLQLLQDYDDSSSTLHASYSRINCTIELRKFASVIQRLLGLVYQVSRNPKDTADQIAQMYLGCFLDVESLECRKILLSSIEPIIVQRKAVEMIMSTICESRPESSHYEERGISLEKITKFYFQKLPRENGPISSCTEARFTGMAVEELTFMLYVLCKSYLQEQHSISLENATHLSIGSSSSTPSQVKGKFGFKCFEDSQHILTIQETIHDLTSRLHSYTVAHLSRTTLLYLNMLSTLFSFTTTGN